MGNPEVSPGSVQQSKVQIGKGDDGTEPPLKKPGSKAQGRRKRTKTGCLTCRKRRLKCGEERPTCQNCTKAKRQCEGYNQRVVFKDPLGAYRPSLSGVSHISFADPRSGPQPVRHGALFQQAPPAPNPLPVAPKPTDSSQSSTKAVDIGLPRPSPGIEYQVHVFPRGTVLDPSNEQRAAPSNGSQFLDKTLDTVDRSHIPDPKRRPPRDQPPHYDFNAFTQQQSGDFGMPPAQLSPLDWAANQSTAPPFHQSYPASPGWYSITTSSALPGQPFQTQPSSSIAQAGLEDFQNVQWDFNRTSQYGQEELLRMIPPVTPLKMEHPLSAHQSDLIEDTDDPFDVSDNDTQMDENSAVAVWQGDPQDVHLRSNDLGIVVALQAGQDNQGLRVRSFVSSIDRPEMLATYAPSIHSSPLHDHIIARIFCHFINVIAPALSMFERHPANPSLIFQGQPVPKSQQHIWTYTFPTLALQNPALLHAMLAISCLHIAQLQNVPVTISLKHYHISLRRVRRCLSLPSRRAQPATLAAAMLLAFYECLGADHQKWSNHLLGAKHLLNQVNFAGMTKYIKKTNRKQRKEERNRYYQAQQQGGGHGYLEDITLFQSYVDDVDENIVSMLMGKKLRYDQHGQILEDTEQVDDGDKIYTEKDLEIYETQRDLYWWYCKQDVYQSILGGGRLLLNYDLWSQCPPRAPLGRLNATYGTYDHLMLLMGRLADFASKDLKRKRLTEKAKGGGRPPESMRMPPPAGQMPQQPPQMPQMPIFEGMIPGFGEAKLPMGFEEYREASPQSTGNECYDMEVQRMEAEEEWQEIRNTFSFFKDRLGDDFEALGPEFSASVQTPFGTALQYRTYEIAGIWMNYYMGLIVCHRTDPAMPPAAMIAAGMAARQTASMANEIGRIAAGLAPDCSMTAQVSPGVGAGLIESAIGLFISGVQYQDAAQRAWTVNRLRDISRLTGWRTAIAIATGCETSWVKAAEAGRSPPYTRTTEERVVPDAWAGTRRTDRYYQTMDQEGRLVIKQTGRVQSTLGVLSLEDDFHKLDLEDNGENLEDSRECKLWMRPGSSKHFTEYDTKPNQVLKRPTDYESVLQVSGTDYLPYFQAHGLDEIEDIIMDCVRNDNLMRTNHKIVFQINWKIKEFMEEQYGPGSRVNIASVVTLTGTALHAQAQTVGEYLKQNWPDTGPEVLELLQKNLNLESADSTDPDREITMKLKTSVFISMDFNGGGSLKVSVLGRTASVVELAQQLAWLGAVLHTSTNGQIMRSRARVTPSLAIQSSDENHFTFDFFIDQLPEGDQTCWHEMFINPVIAFGFTIPDRGDEVGLEIPICLMAALGGASHAIEYEGGLVIKGFSSMLVPLKGNRDSVQWHFIHNKDDSRLPYWEVDRRCPGRALLDTVDHNSLASARAFLGWWGTTTTQLGTANANYENIDWSDIKEPDRHAIFSGGSIGFHNLMIGELNFSVGAKDSKLHISRTGPYRRIIKHASKTPVVLYDTAEKRAWMVPSSAVISHMAQKRHEYDPFILGGKVVDIKASDPTLNVYDAAEEMLSDNSSVILDNDTDGKTPFYFRDLVLRIWTLLESLMDKDIRKETTEDSAMHATTRKSLRGWEFMDIVDERSPLLGKRLINLEQREANCRSD